MTLGRPPPLLLEPPGHRGRALRHVRPLSQCTETASEYEGRWPFGAASALSGASGATTPGRGGSPRRLQSLDAVLGAFTPFGAWHRRLFVLCGLGWMCDAMWIQLVALLLPAIATELGEPPAVAGWVATALFGGMGVGAVVWGRLADRIGRCRVFTATLAVSIAGSLLFAAGTTLTLLCAAAGVLGVGVGGHIVVDTLLFLEFVPPSHRHWVGLLNVFFSIGGVAATLIMWLTVEFLRAQWRSVVGVMVGIECAMLLVRLFLLPLRETPTFLLHVAANADSCFQSLAFVRAYNLARAPAAPAPLLGIPPADDDSDSDRLTSFDEVTSPETHAVRAALFALEKEHLGVRALRGARRSAVGGGWAGRALADAADALKQLWTSSVRRVTASLWLVWLLTNFGYTVFNVYLPMFLATRAESPSVNVYADMLLYTGLTLPAAYFGSALLHRSCFWTLSGALFATGVALLGAPAAATVAGAALSVSLAVISVTSTLMWAGLYTWTPMLYETSVRGLGSGACGTVGRVGGIVAPLVGGHLFLFPSAFGSGAAPLLVGGISLLVASAISLWGLYPSRRRSFDGSASS